MPTYLIYGDTADGYTDRYATTYAEARESGGWTWTNTTYTTMRVGQFYEPAWAEPYTVYQSYMLWDTSIIPDEETVVDATVYFDVLMKPNEIDVTFTARVYNWTPPLDGPDWVPASNLTSYPEIMSFTAAALDGYRWFFNYDFTAYVNKTGTVGLLFNDKKQIDNIAPTSTTQYVRPYASDHTTYDYKPTLEVVTEYAHVEVQPATILTQTNLTGDITTVQNSPDVSDNIWMTANSHTADTELRLGFNALPAGKRFDVSQKFNYRARASSIDEVEVEVHLYEAGVPRGHLATHLVGTEEAIYTVEWAPELLENPAADNVEVRFFTPFITKESAPEFEAVSMSARYVDDVVITPTLPRIQTDFSGNAIGTAPTGWSHLWNVPKTARIQSIDDAVGGVGLITEDDVSSRRAMVWNDAGTAKNVDVVIRAKFNDIVSNSFRVYGRTGGTVGSETGVFAEIYEDDEEIGDPIILRIGFYYSGSVLYYDDTIINMFADLWYRIRLRIFDNSFRAKVWAEGEVEPPWMVDVTANPIYASEPGYIGIGGYAPYDMSVVDMVSVAFDGDIPDDLPPSPSRPYKLPPQPSEVSVTQTADGVLIGWSPVEDISGYKVIRDGKLIATTNELSYLDTEVVYTGAETAPPLLAKGAFTYGVTTYRNIP